MLRSQRGTGSLCRHGELCLWPATGLAHRALDWTRCSTFTLHYLIGRAVAHLKVLYWTLRCYISKVVYLFPGCCQALWGSLFIRVWDRRRQSPTLAWMNQRQRGLFLFHALVWAGYLRMILIPPAHWQQTYFDSKMLLAWVSEIWSSFTIGQWQMSLSQHHENVWC